MKKTKKKVVEYFKFIGEKFIKIAAIQISGSLDNFSNLFLLNGFHFAMIIITIMDVAFILKLLTRKKKWTHTHETTSKKKNKIDRFKLLGLAPKKEREREREP